jgi:methylenetetrahydrofolate reductase (NADPH)
MRAKATNTAKPVKISFEFFPPKNAEMASQLWQTVDVLALWQPEFVSVTYGAGGSTRDTTLSTVARMISTAGLAAASHLTCVGASREDVHRVVEEFRAAGVAHFVALRGDPQGGIGTEYRPFPGGYANAAELTAGLAAIGGLEISVAAYPEKHPESRDVLADIDMLKRKVDAGATRALTQFFFDNDVFERYLERVRAAGITIPILPGILPIHNLAQVKKFAAMCGAGVPAFIETALSPVDDDPTERAKVAAELASAQVRDLIGRGITELHFYTMNRAPLVTTVLELSGLARLETADDSRLAAE